VTAKLASVCMVSLVWPCASTLGEGPVWLPDSRTLWFVDIKQGKLHCLTPHTNTRQSFHLGGAPSFVVPLDNGALLVGNQRALTRVENGIVTEIVATIEMPAHNRTNDATVDRNGILWFGTMDDGETNATGQIYRFDGTLTEAGGGCTITNGPAACPDGRWLYHVDTLARTIWRFEISDGAPILRNATVFAQIDPEHGYPDGITIDSEGCLWVGLWGGWSLRRYGPDGTLLASVALPCANVTKVAFGGRDLRTGYITTARAGLSADELAAQPDAGGLFSFKAPVAGLPVTPLHFG
jgi:D-xylonolactonase